MPKMNPWIMNELLMQNASRATPGGLPPQMMQNATPVSPWMSPMPEPTPASNRVLQSQQMMNNLPQTFATDRQRYDDLLSQYRASQEESMNMQQSGIGQLEQYAQDIRQKPRGIDWTPAASFIDMLNRGTPYQSNFAQTYMQSGLRPESERAKEQRLTDLQLNIQKQKGDLTQSKMSGLKSALDAELGRPDPFKQDYMKAQSEYLRSKIPGELAGKPIKSSEYKAAGFATRARQGLKQLKDLLDKGYDPTSAKHKAQMLRTPEYQSPEYRQWLQAEKLMATATLRPETGAAITPEETKDEARKYVPQWGDDQITIQNKLNAAEMRIKELEVEGQRALPQFQQPATAAPAQEAPPQKGEVRDGYQFLGGDPANQNNWRQL